MQFFLQLNGPLGPGFGPILNLSTIPAGTVVPSTISTQDALNGIVITVPNNTTNVIITSALNPTCVINFAAPTTTQNPCLNTGGTATILPLNCSTGTLICTIVPPTTTTTSSTTTTTTVAPVPVIPTTTSTTSTSSTTSTTSTSTTTTTTAPSGPCCPPTLAIDVNDCSLDWTLTLAQGAQCVSCSATQLQGFNGSSWVAISTNACIFSGQFLLSGLQAYTKLRIALFCNGGSSSFSNEVILPPSSGTSLCRSVSILPDNFRVHIDNGIQAQSVTTISGISVNNSTPIFFGGSGSGCGTLNNNEPCSQYPITDGEYAKNANPLSLVSKLNGLFDIKLTGIKTNGTMNQLNCMQVVIREANSLTIPRTWNFVYASQPLDWTYTGNFNVTIPDINLQSNKAYLVYIQNIVKGTAGTGCF